MPGIVSDFNSIDACSENLLACALIRSSSFPRSLSYRMLPTLYHHLQLTHYYDLLVAYRWRTDNTTTSRCIAFLKI